MNDKKIKALVRSIKRYKAFNSKKKETIEYLLFKIRLITLSKTEDDFIEEIISLRKKLKIIQKNK